jgi:hypothetical protein
MLLEARDEDGSDMCDQQVRDEVLTFLLAGHGSAPGCPVLSESGKVRSWPVAHGSPRGTCQSSRISRSGPVLGNTLEHRWRSKNSSNSLASQPRLSGRRLGPAGPFQAGLRV